MSEQEGEVVTRIRSTSAHQAQFILAAHVHEAVAEALAPVLALVPLYRSHADVSQFSKTYRNVADDIERAAALRAAAGTPTHHTTEEDTP